MRRTVSALTAAALAGGLAAGAAGPASAKPAHPPGVRARKAVSLTDYLGVNTHLDFQGSYQDVPMVEDAIRYLGLTHLRDSPQGGTGSPIGAPHWPAVAAATGATFDAFIGEGSPATMAEGLTFMPGLARAGLLDLIEGGNEEDDPYAAERGNTLDLTKEFQRKVFDTGRRLDLPVVTMSFGAGWTADNDWHGDYDKVGDISSTCDYANAHTYPVPGATADATIRQLNDDAHLAAPSRPVITTEFGYDTAVTSESDAAKGDLDAAFDGLRDGDVRLYYYGLLDDIAGRFGLMHDDATPKLPGFALHNLTTLLHDPRADFRTGTLDYTLAGTRDDDRSMLFQKSDGGYWLALWNETGPAHDVTVTLGAAASRIRLYDPLTGTGAQETAGHADHLTVAVTDHPLLVEITR